MSGIDLIAAERERQRGLWSTEEYSSDDHDDSHRAGELARAAAVYATPRNVRDPIERLLWPQLWEFASGDRIRELTKAGALIAAEIDRLERAGTKEGGE